MTASAPKRILRKFRRNDRGSAAVEFAMVAVPFFALLFAIIETGIVFFAAQVLETGVQDSARLIYTNQVTDKNTTPEEFRTDLCFRVSALLSCDGISIDVKYYKPGDAITINDPILNGGFDPSGFTFSVPPKDSPGTVVVRGFYQWPLIVTGLGYNIANITKTGNANTNKRLLVGLAAFHVEPAP